VVARGLSGLEPATPKLRAWCLNRTAMWVLDIEDVTFRLDLEDAKHRIQLILQLLHD